MQRAQQAQEEAANKPSPEEMEMQMKAQEMQMDMAGKAADMEMQREKNQMDINMKAIDLFIKQIEGQNQVALGNAKLQQDAQRIAIQSEQNRISRQNANSRQTSAAK
jgi:hypothetical protein